MPTTQLGQMGERRPSEGSAASYQLLLVLPAAALGAGLKKAVMLCFLPPLALSSLHSFHTWQGWHTQAGSAGGRLQAGKSPGGPCCSGRACRAEQRPRSAQAWPGRPHSGQEVGAAPFLRQSSAPWRPALRLAATAAPPRRARRLRRVPTCPARPGAPASPPAGGNEWAEGGAAEVRRRAQGRG